MVIKKEKAPEEVLSEEEWDVVAAIVILLMACVEDVKEASQPEKEEGIDIKSWFFEELVKKQVKKEIGVVSYTVAHQEKQH